MCGWWSLVAIILFSSQCLCQVSVSKKLTDAEINILCQSTSITNCKECIMAHPKCAWCASDSIGSKRCKSEAKFHEDKNCENVTLNSPKNELKYLKNNPLSKVGVDSADTVIQLHPQEIELNLRKGETQKFQVTFRKVSDYPVDLYYVMDLSYSMKDDLKTLQNLGLKLATEIQNITSNIQLGFGTFVDKVMMPFASTVPAQLEDPCVENENNTAKCAPPFGFKHQHNISNNINMFRDAVQNTRISGNIDSPEGGFDALMQIAVCKNEIGWRDEAEHLVVFTTDDSFHMALDGKLAAIFEANDMKCHLKRGANKYIPNAVVYEKSKELDYPSIGQLHHAFSKNKIKPIFAVTDKVIDLYKGLESLISDSFVSELKSDSSNIITIINDAYNALKSKVEMTTGETTPSDLDVKIKVMCPNTTEFKTTDLICDNIHIGSEAVYEFEITSNHECTTGEQSPSLITFSSTSLKEEVKIHIKRICDCDCAKLADIKGNSPNCSYNGSLVCGVCQCEPGREGVKCQCDNELDYSLTEQCKKSGIGGTGEICEGHGKCECGVCACEDDYEGTYCQCSNKNCPQNENGPCGGADRGTCRNCNGDAKCECKNGWTLDTNGIKTCSCHTNECKKNATIDLVCSGNGICDCNVCECHNNSRIWTGQYCEKCQDPSCKPVQPKCEGGKMRECAACVHKAQRERKSERELCSDKCVSIAFQTSQSIPDCKTCQSTDPNCKQICNVIDTEKEFPKCATPLANSNCEIKYEVMWNKNTKDYILIVKQFDKENDCKKATDPLLYVLPIIAGIVLLGLAALIAWKIYQTLRDKKEWENFEKEMKQSKWTKDINPVFVNPSNRFENPSYGGDM